MHQYGVRDVEKLLHLSRRAIHGLIKAKFVSPERGPRNEYLFSFQDLIVLRTARALTEARVPAKHITQSLKRLRASLPDAVPLSGLSICAVGDRVVVKEGQARWQADSGQYLLALDVDVTDGSLSVSERSDAAPAVSAKEWFRRGLRLETANAAAARDAYERALAIDPKHCSASVNLGRLLHEAGQLADAERVYDASVVACGGDALVLYNLGVLLEDMKRPSDARAAYEAALRKDPAFADCHYNLGRLFESLGKSQDAIRHLAQYRRLTDR
jgi:tetratricopeptide (TPR) repeat protein